MSGRTPKILAATWVEAARRALVEDGVAAVKIDRLANRLGVTRGGFYHNFKDREEFLDRLIDDWQQNCRFLPLQQPGSTPAEAAVWLDALSARLIEEDGYDHQYDMAVREWARSEQRAAWAVERADRERLATLERVFRALGYSGEEVTLRARVYYYHQIGYYAIGVRESIADRRRNAQLYHEILFGGDALAKARASGKRKTASGKA